MVDVIDVLVKCDSTMVIFCRFVFQAEDGIRYLVRSRGLGDVYKRQPVHRLNRIHYHKRGFGAYHGVEHRIDIRFRKHKDCLLYTSDAADERSSVDLGGRRIIKKKNREYYPADSRLQKNYA